MMRIFLFAPF
ncbi:hypothetical protein B4U80_04413 [Leptotrombidium deliense]|uniref:Uncharacterized protein n=1 Tax=Leptotrombidium deliense TaxID=299467 RepID=A0A443S9H7_9ACAR|nr:hypothetical protein B4U80_04413 [Leptotrombidium deliense]